MEIPVPQKLGTGGTHVLGGLGGGI